MRTKIAGGWMAAAFALSFAASAARADTVVKPGVEDSGKPNPVQPGAPITATDSETMNKLKAQADDLAAQNKTLEAQVQKGKKNFDGAGSGAAVSGSTNAVAGTSTPAVPLPGSARAANAPKIPDQDGDKAEKSFGTNAKKTAGAVGDAVKPIAVTLGVGMFLFGIMCMFIPGMQGFGPGLMIGGALVAVAGTLLGGLLQGSSK